MDVKYVSFCSHAAQSLALSELAVRPLFIEVLRYGLTAGGLASLCSTVGWIIRLRMRLDFYRHVVDVAVGMNQEFHPAEIIRATVPGPRYQSRQTQSRPTVTGSLAAFDASRAFPEIAALNLPDQGEGRPCRSPGQERSWSLRGLTRETAV
jgi:hypothetical protein